MTQGRIKVLIVGPHLDDPGGVTTYYNSVLPRMGHSELAIRYLGIGSSEKRRRLLHKATDQLRYWKALHRFAPDIVHVNPQMDLLSFIRDGLFIFAAKASGTKVLVFYHGWQTGFERVVEQRLNWFFRLTYRRADWFLVLARRFATVLASWGVAAPIVCHHTVVSDELLDACAAAGGVDDAAVGRAARVLFLARLVQGKGALEFARAIASLVDNGVAVQATIAGDGPVMGDLLRETRESGIGHYVKIVGHAGAAQKAHLFATHDLYCLPTSHPEGMPTTVLEAMAFGLPVVTTAAGGVADFFQDEAMGTLLQRPTPREIALAIGRLLSDPARLARIGSYNHRYARHHFLASRAAGFLESTYRAVIAGRPR